MDALLSRISRPNTNNKSKKQPIVLSDDSEGEYDELLSLTPVKTEGKSRLPQPKPLPLPECESNTSDDVAEMTDLLTELSESAPHKAGSCEELLDDSVLSLTPRKSNKRKRSHIDLSEDVSPKKPKLEPKPIKLDPEDEKKPLIRSPRSRTPISRQKLPSRIITEEEEEKHEQLRALSSKYSQFSLPPKCEDASNPTIFDSLRQLLFPNLPSAFNIRNDATPTNQRDSKIVCSICILYRYDSTSFRKSEIIKDLQDQQMRLCENSMGVVVFPTNSKSPYYISFQKEPGSSQAEIISVEQRKQFIQQLMESDSIQKLSHSFQQLLQALMHHEISISKCTNMFDIQIASWVWNPELESYEYTALHDKFLSKPQSTIKACTKENEGTNIFKTTEDCIACMRMHRALQHQLEKHELVDSYLSEMRVVPCIAKMEYNGIQFNSEELRQHKEYLSIRKKQLLERAQELVNRKVVLSSPPDVAIALYSDLRLPKRKKRAWKRQKTEDSEEMVNETYWEGATKDSVLQSLAELHEFPKVVLEYRQCKILLSNWIDSLPSKSCLDPITQSRAIYSHWIQTGTSTGRLSSKNPNLQSLPKRSIEMQIDGRDVSVCVRNAFVARPGYVLIAADYSQLEMRILAHISNDSYLNEFFAMEQDIHTLIASRWLGKAIEEVTSIERERSKKIVYGIVYGIGSVSLAEMLGVEPPEATSFIHSFLDKFPDIKTWTEKVVFGARKSKMVRTLTNRRRLLPLINSKDRSKKKRAERQAINTPIQGTASDITKAAMARIDEKMTLLESEVQFPVARLLMNIHDELVYEVAVEYKQQIVELIKYQMEDAICLSTSIPVCIFEGTKLGDLKPIILKKQSKFLNLLRMENSPYVVMKGEISCIMSMNPLHPGHCIVLPSTPIETWDKIPPELMCKIMETCREVCRALRVLYPNCEVMISSGKEKERHSHFHLIPHQVENQIEIPNTSETTLSVIDQQNVGTCCRKIRDVLNLDHIC